MYGTPTLRHSSSGPQLLTSSSSWTTELLRDCGGRVTSAAGPLPCRVSAINRTVVTARRSLPHAARSASAGSATGKHGQCNRAVQTLQQGSAGSAAGQFGQRTRAVRAVQGWREGRQWRAASLGGTGAIGSFDDEEISSDIPPPPPPSEGRIEIAITKDMIRSLDLTSAHNILRTYMARLGDYSSDPEGDVSVLLERKIGFSITYERDDPLDPRELSEMPDIRLWFVRLDVAYPWLPVVLDWRGGELGRYAAMLVPHQMSRRMGLVFNPEALELWVMGKVFLIYEWLKLRGAPRPDLKIRDMMKVLGFGASDSLFEIIEGTKDP